MAFKCWCQQQQLSVGSVGYKWASFQVICQRRPPCHFSALQGKTSNGCGTYCVENGKCYFASSSEPFHVEVCQFLIFSTFLGNSLVVQWSLVGELRSRKLHSMPPAPAQRRTCFSHTTRSLFWSQTQKGSEGEKSEQIPG